MKLVWFCLSLFAVFGITLITAAQDDVITFSDGTTITLSSDWTIKDSSEDFFEIENAPEELAIRMYFYTADVLESEEVDSLVKFAEYDYSAYDASADNPFDDRQLKDSEIASLPSVEYTFEQTLSDGEKVDITVIYVILSTDAGIAIEVSPYFLDSIINLEPVYDLFGTLSDGSNSRGATRVQGDVLELVDLTTLTIPSNWTATDGSNADSKILFSTDKSYIYLFIEPGVGGMGEFDTPAKYLAYVYKNNFTGFDSGEVVNTELGGLPVAYYDFLLPDGNAKLPARMVMILLPNTNYLLAYVVPNGDFDDNVQEGVEILDSVVGSDTVLCYVFAPDGVNLRAKPSTSGAVVRKIDNNTSTGDLLIADYVTPDGGGALWFHLVVDDAFVRQDVVVYDNNSCGNLPVQ